MKQRSTNGSAAVDVSSTQTVSAGDRQALDEPSLQWMISRERKRVERSHKSFLLIVLDMGDQLPSAEHGRALRKVLLALSRATRETDATGWYKKDAIVGVMLTEIALEERNSIVKIMMARIRVALRAHLSLKQFQKINISFHLFPEDWKQENPERPTTPDCYPELLKRDNAREVSIAIKRTMDIVGSVLSLVLCAPIFLIIAIVVKMSSKGPVFFRQERVGQHGRPFMFLKFRSMYVDSDPTIHKEYVRHLIAGDAERKPTNGNKEGIYKLTADPRVTWVGRLLRRTSLDELPQFWNVLKGEMSLVGPRPAIAYEVEAYDTWHRRRILEAKPGITGLWQVSGRNRVRFDEMVRLDLKYACTWSPWMDFKILLRTPRAVVLDRDSS